jgi:hypothetical protein
MDKEQARQKLRLFRPGTDDAHDPEMAEALAWTQRDAELAQWHENQNAVYLAMRRKLKEIPVPQDLKREILREDAVGRERIVTLRNPALPLAAAAAIVLLGVALVSFFTGKAKENFRDCRERMVLESQRGYQMVVNTNLNEIHAGLLAKACPDYSLTPPLAKLPAEGYAALPWHKRKVSMVCLKAGHDQDLFLFVMDAGELRDAPATGAVEFAKIHRLNSASWSANGKIYILAGPQDDAGLRRYLD